MECGARESAAVAVARCSICGGLLDVDLRFDRKLTPNDFLTPSMGPWATSGVWRYQPLLPRLPDEAMVSRSEGRTPIYEDERLRTFAGVKALGLKHEGQNPTASFKDRGMTVGISHAKSVGAKMVACASTGNTSASLASYAAAADMPALVLLPEGKISGSKLAQTIAHGAIVVQIEGDFDAALALLRQLTDTYAVYLVNSVNPFRIEGQKTIVIEMLEQLSWQVPDVIALPGGNLGNTAAFGKALSDCWHAGLIDRMPKLVTAQAAGAAPFVDYFESGFDHYEPVAAETIATAIKIGDPASVERARRALTLTEGCATRVTDEEILEAKAWIDRVGIGCEPASAASLAGLRKLVAAGTLPADVNAVCVLTGHVLKDPDAVISYHLGGSGETQYPLANPPRSVAANLDALERMLADALHG